MSGRCGGLHCDGCGRGPGGLVALVVVLVLAAAAGPVVQAVTDLLEIALTIAGGLLVIGAGLAVLVWRHRRRAQRRLPVVLVGRELLAPIERRRVVAAIEPARPDAPALPRGDVPAHSRIDADTHVVTCRAARPRRPRRNGRWS